MMIIIIWFWLIRRVVLALPTWLWGAPRRRIKISIKFQVFYFTASPLVLSLFVCRVFVPQSCPLIVCVESGENWWLCCWSLLAYVPGGGVSSHENLRVESNRKKNSLFFSSIRSRRPTWHSFSLSPMKCVLLVQRVKAKRISTLNPPEGLSHLTLELTVNLWAQKNVVCWWEIQLSSWKRERDREEMQL